ncbi:hypothetical protein G7054_g6513 [Neopestalotiopsis clavispora]|nr:hypothetical protein G7054_g6513 [Neopestalotiopsis clavispora]
MLAGYKYNIAIALADANLRSTTVTLQVLNEYKDMIQSTSQDLEDHLREINDKLEALATRSISRGTPTLEQQRMRDERDSTEQCLGICEEVLSHINSMRLLPLSDDPKELSVRAVLKGRSLQELDRSHLITLSALAECSDKLVDTVIQLKVRNRDARQKLQDDCSQTLATANDTAEAARKLEEERLSAEQCLAICAQASGNVSSNRIHTLEDVTMGDDGQQIFVSTLGDLFNLKGVSAGDGAIQFIGSVSDTTLQHYFLYQQHH